MRKSLRKDKQGEPTKPEKVIAEIKDLYWEKVGSPSVVTWFIEFKYTKPRSATVFHDWESIQQNDQPTAVEWADRILSRFDCINRESLEREIAKWIEKNI